MKKKTDILGLSWTIARGLNAERRYLLMIDGRKALRAAIDRVFGTPAEVPVLPVAQAPQR